MAVSEEGAPEAAARKPARARPATGSAARGAKAALILAELRAAILDHRIRPGSRLPEDEIGSIYGVSRTIVRSALQALAHERLVTITPNRGAQVAEPTAEEARQVFEARSVVEPRVAALAATRADPASAERLRRHLAEEKEALARGDNGGAIKMSGDFHVTIAEMAEQPILEGFVRELVSRSSLIVALYWHRQDALCERHAHAALADAIAAGKADDAADLMLSHIVDLLSGLDLKGKPQHEARLADILVEAPKA